MAQATEGNGVIFAPGRKTERIDVVVEWGGWVHRTHQSGNYDRRMSEIYQFRYMQASGVLET